MKRLKLQVVVLTFCLVAVLLAKRYVDRFVGIGSVASGSVEVTTTP